MIKGSEKRTAEHPIDRLFLDRWSPRAMTGEAVSMQELMIMFEAARWSPSSYNAQPWRMLYAHRDSEHWPLFFDLLVDFNKSWVKNAGVLVAFVSKKIADNGKPAITHSFDTGAAWENFALQGSILGLVVHGMQGLDYERAHSELKLPQEYRVEMMAAVGKPGPKEVLPPQLQERETPSNRRRLAETICEGPFSL